MLKRFFVLFIIVVFVSGCGDKNITESESAINENIDKEIFETVNKNTSPEEFDEIKETQDPEIVGDDRYTTMIDIVGMKSTTAVEELKKMGITLVIDMTEESEKYEPGQIINQTISSGEVIKRGSTVYATVCVGPDCNDVPNVVNMESEDAKQILESNGFAVNREYEYNENIKSGMVVRQDPFYGILQTGETVIIYISQGPEKTKVPNVVGKAEADAKAALRDAEFNVGTVTQENSDTAAAGQVISQTIKGDSYAVKGETVNLVVSKGKAEATKYYFKADLTAPSNLPKGATVLYANIELSVEDEPIATWNRVTNFPYTISKSDITGYTSGLLIIEWYYTDENGVTQTSVQEANVDFKS